jgi:hypothetical protein
MHLQFDPKGDIMTRTAPQGDFKDTLSGNSPKPVPTTAFEGNGISPLVAPGTPLPVPTAAFEGNGIVFHLYFGEYDNKQYINLNDGGWAVLEKTPKTTYDIFSSQGYFYVAVANGPYQGHYLTFNFNSYIGAYKTRDKHCRWTVNNNADFSGTVDHLGYPGMYAYSKGGINWLCCNGKNDAPRSVRILKYEKVELTYSQISFKASHNTYERNEPIAAQLTFDNEEPHQCGCMALEFDIWRHTSPYVPGESISDLFFTIGHVMPGEITLKRYLDIVKKWHTQVPNHLPVLITLDIKSSLGGYDNFHLQIDTYLKVHFGENFIFKPSELSSEGGGDLCRRVINNGWPKIKQMNGKFLFCLSGNPKWKSEYTQYDLLTDRLCFSDRDLEDNDETVTPPNTGHFVFFNFHIWNKNKDIWMKTIPPFAQKNLIVRAYEANSETNWNNCLKAKVSAIATNKIRDHSWARVSPVRPYKTK